MRKIILSISSILAIAALAGYGSYALWSDAETSTGNSVTADKLDLVLANFPVSVANVAPGQGGESSHGTVSNDSGNVSGTLYFQIKNASSDENGCPEAESVEGQDPTCANPGVGEGELDQNLLVSVNIDTNGDGIAEYVSNPGTVSNIAARGNVIFPNGDPVLTPGQNADVWLTYQAQDTGTYPAQPNDNIYMTDSVSFDVVAQLTQL